MASMSGPRPAIRDRRCRCHKCRRGRRRWRRPVTATAHQPGADRGGDAEQHRGRHEQLHPHGDPRCRGTAGYECAGHRAGAPQGVEAGDDRTPEAALERESLGVHRHVGEPVEGAEHDEHAEHDERHRRQPERGETHRHRRRRHDRHHAGAIALNCLAAGEAGSESTEARAEQRQAERRVGDAELRLDLGKASRPRRQ